jgi:hypothetical protein
MAYSSYLDTAILTWIKGTNMPAAPAAVYVALYNGDPYGAGTEVTTTIRVAGRVAAAFGAISSLVISNSGLVDFGNAAGSATVSHFAIFDAASSGNMIGGAAITGGAQSIATTNPTSFAIGALTITAS